MSNFCPNCGIKSKVIDTRPASSAIDRIRRRRECLACGHRYTTIEITLETYETLMDQVLKLVKLQRILNG